MHITKPKLIEVKTIIIFAGLILLPTVSAAAQVSQGGGYRIDQIVIASGGGMSSSAGGETQKVEGTIGQPVAGTLSNNGSNLIVRSGFWNFAPLSPTAADSVVSGRLFSAEGRAVFGASVTLTDTDGRTRMARTNPFGFFLFNDVRSGTVYVVNIWHKQYRFAAEVINVGEDLAGLTFVALPKD